MIKKRSLGKGLEALFEEHLKGKEDVFVLDVSKIRVNKEQPRKSFNLETLSSLADSIKRNGVIQPIVVRKTGDEIYQIIAGERRFRAAKMAGLLEIPVIVKDVDDEKTMEIALIENLQREDLNPIEEAESFTMLMEEHRLTQDEVAKLIGKSRSAVANTIRLLNLPMDVKNHIKNGDLTSGQARALLALKDEEEIKKTALKIIEKGISVREIEKMSQGKDKKTSSKNHQGTEDLARCEREIEKILKRDVKIIVLSKGNGKITIEFKTEQDLKDLIFRLRHVKEGVLEKC